MKKVLTSLTMLSVCSLSLYAVQADGANYCADKEFSKPIKYVAIKDTKVYSDAYDDAGYEKVKKGAVYNVYSIGKECSGSSKTVFMNGDNVGFTGLKMSDFQKSK
ncbi:MAG: hypothetical protein RBT59_00320 [Arcobacteraceae bacterium]|jgi:hypothetical protein|nr:hypothetical protein [Arcobacteraceae bacterium]